MFKIGELFSKLTQVTVRMLRYYDETGLLKPEQTDPATGYRMYSVEQIPLLNKIVYFQDSGFHVGEIAELLSGTDGQMIELLDKKHRQIEQTIQAEKERLRKIQHARRELQSTRNEMHYCVSLCHDTEYREQNVDVELCVPVKNTGANTGPFTFRLLEAAPVMACTMVYGEFSNIAGTYTVFAKWLEKDVSDDGSPVLDIKPYTPSLDRIEAPGVPQWCSHWPKSLEEAGCFDWEEEFNF